MIKLKEFQALQTSTAAIADSLRIQLDVETKECYRRLSQVKRRLHTVGDKQIHQSQPIEDLIAGGRILDDIYHIIASANGERRRRWPSAVVSMRERNTVEIRLMTSDGVEERCGHILDHFQKHTGDTDSLLRVVDSLGTSLPLSEVMDSFFRVIASSKFGLFTSALDDAVEDVEAGVALIPTVTGDRDCFRAVGRVLAKCLQEGIRVSLFLNSSSLDFMLGQHQQWNDEEEALASLSETNSEEANRYRKLLHEGRDEDEPQVDTNCSEKKDLANHDEDTISGDDSHKEGTVSGDADDNEGTDPGDVKATTEDISETEVTRVIWTKLVESRRESLASLQEGLQDLKQYSTLQALSGRELQMLLLGTYDSE